MSKYIFDNSNLAESYSGVTTPLTFSFARYIYQEVYKSFCKMMGVRARIIDKNDDMFSNMVVFIGYRMYYDLINWYRLISFLPGYNFNKRFLEKMMGVKKEYDYSKDSKNSFAQKYLIDFPLLVWQFVKIVCYFIFMDNLVNRFNKNFDDTYNKFNNIDLERLDSIKLKEIYLSLTKDLTDRWRVPIANDLAVMVSTGIADALFNQWLPEELAYDYMHISSSKSLISLDPGLEICNIIKYIKKDESLSDLFFNNNSLYIWQTLNTDYTNNQSAKLIFDYIDKFGNRSPNELKLESKTLKEDPQMFITFLKSNLSMDISEGRYVKQAKKNNFNDRLSFTKNIILKFLLKWGQNSIDRREQTRFKRTLIFGYARRIFLQIATNLKKDNILLSSRDIFYLDTEDIFSILDKESSKEEIYKIIEHKKAELNYWQYIDLPRRVETDKSIGDLEVELKGSKKDIKLNGQLKGTVASKIDKDTISGEALVMENFDSQAEFNNKILITKQTDPGWIIAFTLIKGLVVERGGMLSHAAIVARELGIPCIIGVENATDCIKNHDVINLDLSTGQISYE